ncbi:MAG: transposase [Gemmataceae bacterium]|nr:transposase [Gemmataceae bacterium]
MTQPLVIAHHLIWTAYGWWLPNDPRGSGSHTIRNELLAEFGELHYGRKKLQPAGKIVRQFYEQVADVLKHPLLTFDEPQRLLVGEAFAQVIEEQRYTCYACAIMPDHVHAVIRKHKHQAEEMVDFLKEASRNLLIKNGQRALTHPTWLAGHGWKVFLDHPDEVWRTIRYVEQNPIKIGLPAQSWSFVKPYDNWPLHPGHSPNSPYARRLRAVGRYP